MRPLICWALRTLALSSLIIASAIAQPSGPYTLSIGSGSGSLSMTTVGSFGNVDGDNATFDNGTDAANTTVWNLCWFIYDETNDAQYFLEDSGFGRTGSPYPTDGTVAQPDGQSLTNTGMGFPSSAGLTADMSMQLSQPDPGNTVQCTWAWDFSNAGGSDIALRVLFFVDLDSYIDTNDYFDDMSAIIESGAHDGAAIALGNIAGSALNLDDGILMESVDQRPDRVFAISDDQGCSYYWSSQFNFVGVGPGDANQIDNTLADTVQNDADVNYLADTGNDSGGVMQINVTVPAGGSVSRSFTATWGVDTVVTEGTLPPPPLGTPDPITNWYVANDLITDAGTPVPTQMAGTALVGNDFYVVGGNAGGDTDAVWRLEISGVLAGPSVAEPVLPGAEYAYVSDSVVATDSHVYVVGGGWNSTVPTLWDRVQRIAIQPDGSLDPGGWTASAVFPNGYVHQLGSAVIPDNGYLYVFNGQDDNTSTFYNDCYYAQIQGDGSLGAWQTGSSTPQATWFTGSTTIDNFIITAGGTPSGGSGALDEIWVCEVNPDGTMGSWTVQTEVLPEARYGTKLVAVENDILAIGGRSSAGGTSSQSNVWRATFDPGTGTVGAWTTVDAQLPAPLHYHDALYSPDEQRVYVFASRSVGDLLNQMFSSTLLFTPPTTAAQGWSRYR